MTARYRGTCIGGVADGHWIERDDHTIKIDAKKRNPVDGQADPIVESTEYTFLILLANSNSEVGVWAPNGVTIVQIVERLVRFYNPRTGMIGVPVPNAIPIRPS